MDESANGRDGAGPSSRFKELTKKVVKNYKSEYKKNFLPFTDYEYIDGKFFKKREHQEPESPWYKEVIELRQKAGEYKYRGWGTDLVGTTVVVPAFNHSLWKHVSHKSSFNALALITTTSRALAKKDKSKDGGGPSSTGSKSSQSHGLIRRPHTATPKHPLGSSSAGDGDNLKIPKDDDSHSHPSGTTKSSRAKQVKPVGNFQNKGRSQSAEPGLRYRTRNLPTKQQGSTTLTGDRENAAAGATTTKSSSKDPENLAPHHHPPGSTTGTGDTSIAKHRRPTTLSTSPRSRSTASSSGSRDQSKSTIRQHFNKGSVDRSLDGTDDIVVKTPPEPTRVKSPEQVMLKSPDPVNWMVPLDTTRGFTVTQSLPKGPTVVGGA